jgi:hypothetical protein
VKEEDFVVDCVGIMQMIKDEHLSAPIANVITK